MPLPVQPPELQEHLIRYASFVKNLTIYWIKGNLQSNGNHRNNFQKLFLFAVKSVSSYLGKN